MLRGISRRGFLTIGVHASGVTPHDHDQTWLGLLHGAKAWWFAEKLPQLEELVEGEPEEMESGRPHARGCDVSEEELAGLWAVG